MDWEQVFQLIDPRLFAVVVVCWILGGILKTTPLVPNWSIVYIVVIVAVIMTSFIIGWGVEAVIQGVLAGAFAVLGHQFIKQTAKAAGGSNE
ncbi:phage holin family protein [Paenibacillus sp. FSL M8-0142]|uniref:phage holin family protein n=1 Tax=Paenibacillus TaxID=44249 RepID=UPI003159E2E4